MHAGQLHPDNKPISCWSAQGGLRMLILSMQHQAAKQSWLLGNSVQPVLRAIMAPFEPDMQACRQTVAEKADPRLSQTSSSELGAASAVQAL